MKYFHWVITMLNGIKSGKFQYIYVVFLYVLFVFVKCLATFVEISKQMSVLCIRLRF